MFRSLRDLRDSIDAAFSPGPHDSYVGRIIPIPGMPPLRLGAVFAEGGFSFVHRADPQSSSSYACAPLAVKRMCIADGESQDIARSEAAFCAALPPHPNVVRYCGSLFTASDAFLAFEMVDGGTLPDIIDRRTAPLSPDEALAIFADAVAAVVHLHAQPEPISCRDVKLENLLYDRISRCYKLCDLGSCTAKAVRYSQSRHRELLEAEDAIKAQSSAAYRAPELCDLYAGHFVCEVSDVWSLGCVWYAILYKTLPFGDGQSSLAALQGIKSVPGSPPWPESFTKLALAMLTVDPAKRPDSFTILEVVCRLQGREMDADIREIGARLRERRRRDFVGEGAPIVPAASGLPLWRLAAPASAPPRLAPVASAEPNFVDVFKGRAINPSKVVPAPVAQSLVAFKDGAAGDNGGDDDWADFDSGFNSSPATADRSVQASLQTPPPPLQSQRGSSRNGTRENVIDRATFHAGASAASSSSIGNLSSGIASAATPPLSAAHVTKVTTQDNIFEDLISFHDNLPRVKKC
jgi:serine/threonine protein kinase